MGGWGRWRCWGVNKLAMHEYLPRIDFAVRQLPIDVIKDMAIIAEKSGIFIVEREFNVMGDSEFHIINLRFKGESPHEELGAQLICRDDLKYRVAVELRAHRWNPDPPTTQAYCQAAKDLVDPIIRAYNATHGNRYRLRISRMKPLKTHLSAASLKNFNRFTILSNKSSLHPLDWKRLYQFVRRSRSNTLSEGEMAALLVQHGFSEQYAERIALIYTHLCEYKSVS
jgi:hypothetical protein